MFRADIPFVLRLFLAWSSAVISLGFVLFQRVGLFDSFCDSALSELFFGLTTDFGFV
jgi:hypothetical protein